TAQLLPSDTDHGWDVYMLDRVTGTMELLSVSATGTGSDSLHALGGASVSDDGRYAVFHSDSATLVGNDVDPTNNTTTDSAGHVIPLFPLGRADDVFLRDRVLGTTTLVSAAPDGSGAQGYDPSITPDGRFVVFGGSGNLLAGGDESFGDVLVYSTATGALE